MLLLLCSHVPMSYSVPSSVGTGVPQRTAPKFPKHLFHSFFFFPHRLIVLTQSVAALRQTNPNQYL